MNRFSKWLKSYTVPVLCLLLFSAIPLTATLGKYAKTKQIGTIDLEITKAQNLLINGVSFNTLLNDHCTQSVKNLVFDYANKYPQITTEIEGIDIGQTENHIKLYVTADTAYILSDATIYANPDCRQMFSGLKFRSIQFNNFNTSEVVTMNQMFYRCILLTSLDVSSFDTANVTNMNEMFYYCSALTSLDLSSFNTVNVTNMNEMFYCCSALTSLDVSSFDTAKITNMNQMFCGCAELTSLDVSSFDTANVTDMSSMFSYCSALTSLDVSSFNTSSVTNMTEMFYYCRALTSLDVSRFNTAKVTSMDDMFNNCEALTSLDVSRFNTANVTNMSSMFRNCYALTSLDVSSFNTAKVTNMGYMFYMMYTSGNLKTIYAGSKWTTSKIINDIAMFTNCTSLVGGNGTTYSKTDKTYACIDTPSTPGYFTDINDKPAE